MNRDDIIRMAREAGISKPWDQEPVQWGTLERFAALVAAAEREACAKVCEAECIGFANDDEQLNRIAFTIRERGAP